MARSGGSEGIFFTGWRGHDELPEGLNAADVLVAPSVDEPFGQVYLEAMACGLPVIATATGGPLSFVNTAPGHPSGWLVDPDDEAVLAATLIEVVSDAAERRARGEAAYEQIRGAYAWDTVATRVASLYEACSPQRARRKPREGQRRQAVGEGAEKSKPAARVLPHRSPPGPHADRVDRKTGRNARSTQGASTLQPGDRDP